MDNLNNIPNSGNWGDAASKLNDNFNKVKQAITTVENTSKNNKGYFSSLSALNTAFPNPKAGQTAYVYSEASSTKYYIYNAFNGAWVASSIEAPSIGVDISEYTKTGGSTKTTKEVEDEMLVMSMDFKDVHEFQTEFSPFENGGYARGVVPTALRKVGAIITYQLDTGERVTERRVKDITEEISWGNNKGWRPITTNGIGIFILDNFGRQIKFDSDNNMLTIPAGIRIVATGYPREVYTIEEDMSISVEAGYSIDLFYKKEAKTIVPTFTNDPTSDYYSGLYYSNPAYVHLGNIISGRCFLNGVTAVEYSGIKRETQVRLLGESLFKYQSVTANSFDNVHDLRAYVFDESAMYHTNGKRRRFSLASAGRNAATTRPMVRIFAENEDGSWSNYASWNPATDTYQETEVSMLSDDNKILFYIWVKNWDSWVANVSGDEKMVGNVLSDHLFHFVDTFMSDFSKTKETAIKAYEAGGYRVDFPVIDRKGSCTFKLHALTDLTSVSPQSASPILLRMRDAKGGTNICFDLRFQKTNATPPMGAVPETFRIFSYDYLNNDTQKGRLLDNTQFENGSLDQDCFSVRLKNPTNDNVDDYMQLDKANGVLNFCKADNSIIYSFEYDNYNNVRELFDDVKSTLPDNIYEVLDWGSGDYPLSDLGNYKVFLCKMVDYYVDNVSQGYQVPDSWPCYVATYKKNFPFEVTLDIEPDDEVEDGAVMRCYVNGALLSVFRHTAEQTAIYNNKLCAIYVGQSSETSGVGGTTLPAGILQFDTYEYRRNAKKYPRHMHFYFHNIYGTRVREYDGMWLGSGHENPEGIQLTSTNYHTTYGRFARLLKDLKEHGFVPLSTSEFSDCFYGNKERPMKSYSFHFDDGLFDAFEKPDVRQLFAEYGVKPFINLLGYTSGGTYILPEKAITAKIVQQIGWTIGYHGNRHWATSRMTYNQFREFIDETVEHFTQNGLSADQWAIAFSSISQQSMKAFIKEAGLRNAYWGSGYNGKKTSCYYGTHPAYQMKRAEASDYAPYSLLLEGIKELAYVAMNP